MCAHCRNLNARAQDSWRDANPELAAQKSRESVAKWIAEYPERHKFLNERAFQNRYPTDADKQKFYRGEYHKKMAKMTPKEQTEFHRAKSAKQGPRKRGPKEAGYMRNYMKQRLAKLKKDPVAYEAYLSKRRKADAARRAKLKKDPVAYEAQQVKRRASEKRSRERKRAADE